MRKLAITISALAMLAAFGCKSRIDRTNDMNRAPSEEPAGQGGGPRSGGDYGPYVEPPSGGVGGGPTGSETPGAPMEHGGSGMGSPSDMPYEMGGKDASVNEEMLGGKDAGYSGEGTGGLGGGPNMGGADMPSGEK